ncbi:hypothetical protein GF323_06195 [Candidatus Woesearchaeota archaeon]|nr:hypothetical protein [Candidatus Woesearchaeota archaeon]
MTRNWFIEDFFESMDWWGLPLMLVFLLVFTLVFAVLEKTKILGQEKRNLNVVLSLVMALAVILPHVTNSYYAYLGFDPVEVILRALPQVSVLVVAIFMLLLIIGVFAHDRVFLGLTMPGWIGFFSIIAIIFIFGAAAEWWDGGFSHVLEDFFGEDAIAIVIMILVFGIIIAFITGDSSKDKKLGGMERLGFNLGELFGKNK